MTVIATTYFVLIVVIWRALIRYCAHSFSLSKLLHRPNLVVLLLLVTEEILKGSVSRVHLLIAKHI